MIDAMRHIHLFICSSFGHIAGQKTKYSSIETRSQGLIMKISAKALAPLYKRSCYMLFGLCNVALLCHFVKGPPFLQIS